MLYDFLDMLYPHLLKFFFDLFQNIKKISTLKNKYWHVFYISKYKKLNKLYLIKMPFTAIENFEDIKIINSDDNNKKPK